MSLQLPQAVAVASGWQLSDYRPEVVIQSEPAPAGEAAVGYGPQLAGDELWLIDHAVSVCTSAHQTSLRMWAGSPGGVLLDGSDAGNFVVADWPMGLQLAPGRQLCVEWAAADAGAVGRLFLQVRVLRLVSG